jgi:hypothetical protein
MRTFSRILIAANLLCFVGLAAHAEFTLSMVNFAAAAFIAAPNGK